MRKLFPIISIGCASIIILGLIGAGITMLIYGAKPFLEKLSSKRAEHQAGQPVHNDDHQPLPAPQQGIPGPFNAVNPAGLQEKKNLLEARKGFQTHLLGHAKKGPRQSLEIDDPNSIIKYGPNKLQAVYFSPKPKNDRKFPAVVWAHSGTSGVSKELWEELAPFRDAGFVVMCPTFRGEQGNPGAFELFYGEVDDLLAAVEYVWERPDVNREHIYVIGEKGGGTLSLLCAATGPQRTSQVRAYFALSPICDMEEFASQKLLQKDTPFILSNTNELRLRSPIRFAKFIDKPTFCFNAQKNPSFWPDQAQRMQSVAEHGSIPFHAYKIPKASRDNLDKLIPVFVGHLLSDKGAKCNIVFKETELIAPFEQ